MGLEVLLNDMEHLVEDGVKSSIQANTQGNACIEGDQKAVKHAKFLDDWMNTEKK